MGKLLKLLKLVEMTPNTIPIQNYSPPHPLN